MTRSIHVQCDTLPEAWERAVLECWDKGIRIPTQHDKNGDPNSRDVAAMIHVRTPFAEPRLHRSMPGGLNDLEKYRMEVLHGVHDHWIDPSSPTKWEYTYHQRLQAYECHKKHRTAEGNLWISKEVIDQIYGPNGVVEQIKNCWFTRRAQAMTAQVWNDQTCKDPACLTRLWFRGQTCERCGGSGRLPEMGGNMGSRTCPACNGVGWRLNMHCHIRSNDAFKAGFMNMYAFTQLQKDVATAAGVMPGEYLHFADSFHIYGSYFDEFDGFLKNTKKRADINDRVYDSTGIIPGTESERVMSLFIEGLDELLAEPDMPADKRVLVQARKDQLLGYMAHNIPVETFANRVDAPAVIIEGGEITIPVDALAQDQLNTNADPSGQR